MTGQLARMEQDREQIFKDLERSERRWRIAVEMAPIGMLIVVDRVILFANRRMSAITGYRPDELIGKPTRILYPDEESWLSVGQIAAAQTEPFVAHLVRKDGQTIACEIRVGVVDGPDREWVVTYFYDQGCGNG